MASARDIARKVGPWVGTIAAASALAFGVSGGCNFVRPESRPMATLAGKMVATGSPVTNEGLLGKPAIINVWSPG
jgi:hypothetical protein